jgi:hypothetical protein
MIIGFAALGMVFALTGTASAGESTIPDDIVVVSSTVLGSGSFTMTTTNVGTHAADLDLAAPGQVSGVSVDFGSYDGRWVLNGLASGATATMTGLLRPWMVIA